RRVAAKLGEAILACGGASRHDRTRGNVLALLRYGRQGDTGVMPALKALHQAFVAAVGPDRVGGADEAKADSRAFIYSNRAAQLLADESYDTQWAPPPEPSGDQPASDDQPSLLIQRAVNGTWLGAQQFPPLEHAVDGIIPEGLGILVAPPK